MATDLLERIRSEINERLAQLRPLLSEYERLAAAAETLAAVGAAPLPAVQSTPPRVMDAAPRGSVDTAAETSLKVSQAKRPHTPPARIAPKLSSAEAPPSADASRLPAEAPRLPVEASADPAEEPPTPALRRAYPLRGSDGGIKLAMSLRTTPLQRPTPRPAATSAAGPPNATQVLERPPCAPLAVEGDTWEPSPPVANRAPARKPASPAAVRQAILAALEHGSHTANELVMVTAMSASEIRGGLIRLTGSSVITKVKRYGDGKTAYALPFARA